ncbi:hypothetical protein TrCOL_g3634, partial [Triparma columacea]
MRRGPIPHGLTDPRAWLPRSLKTPLAIVWYIYGNDCVTDMASSPFFAGCNLGRCYLAAGTVAHIHIAIILILARALTPTEISALTCTSDGKTLLKKVQDILSTNKKAQECFGRFKAVLTDDTGQLFAKIVLRNQLGGMKPVTVVKKKKKSVPIVV